MPTITKRDLVRILVEQKDIGNGLASYCVDILFDAMREAITEGNRIEIRGLGSWKVSVTNPRPNARNPRTGERVYVPARRKVGFRPGKVLKKELFRPRGEGEVS